MLMSLQCLESLWDLVCYLLAVVSHLTHRTRDTSLCHALCFKYPSSNIHGCTCSSPWSLTQMSPAHWGAWPLYWKLHPQVFSLLISSFQFLHSTYQHLQRYTIPSFLSLFLTLILLLPIFCVSKPKRICNYLLIRGSFHRTLRYINKVVDENFRFSNCYNFNRIIQYYFNGWYKITANRTSLGFVIINMHNNFTYFQDFKNNIRTHEIILLESKFYK